MEIKSHHFSNYYKILQNTPDEEDLLLHSSNCSPDLMTQRIHELVPLLRFVHCTVDYVGKDKAVLSIPLLDSAINQNGTQQAAVFYLLSDCALAVGIFGVLPGVYATGIHDRCRALPIQYWTKQGIVHHLAPGTGTIRAVVGISQENTLNMRQQLIAKGRTECHEIIHIYQEHSLIATGDFVMGVYADLPRIPSVRTSIRQVQNIKLSALLIAGLRADPLSQSVAQEQGRAIAHRMSLSTPQLPTLIQARTAHLENYLMRKGEVHQQVVVLGVGLDTKPFRFASAGQKWFGVDLRSMIQERKKLFLALDVHTDYFTSVEGDIRTENWLSALSQAGYQRHLATLFVLEGLSMYLTEPDLRRVLAQLRSLTCNNASCVWLDHVTESIFQLDLSEVKAFLSSMTRLGEPFLSGFADATPIVLPYWKVITTVSSANVLGILDIIHEEYRFTVLGILD